MTFRKRPIVIEAFKWTGDVNQTEDPVWICDAIRAGTVTFKNEGSPLVCLLVKTLEGTMRAEPGDWIIRGIKGEIYPCKPDIFEATYEQVGTEAAAVPG
jgi:hypothetical protein